MSDSSTLERSKVIFVLGGPGSGKGTVCGTLSSTHDWPHYSAGDLLRAEAAQAATSPLGAKIAEFIGGGKIVPPELLMDLLKTAMERALAERPGKDCVFLIDGFPRSLAQASQFEASVTLPTAILYLECDKDTMLDRCLQRGAATGRQDDNMETLVTRHQQFLDVTVPVLEHYRAQGRPPIIQVDGKLSKQEVLSQTENELKKVLSI